MNTSVVVFLVAALVVGAGVLILMTMTRRGGRALDVAKYQSQWLAIERTLVADQPTTAEIVILRADKLVDQALRERGYTGQTMGERMKNAQSTWSNANHIWGAHKLRNQLAHEQNFTISYQSAKRALVAYRQALKDLGAI